MNFDPQIGWGVWVNPAYHPWSEFSYSFSISELTMHQNSNQNLNKNLKTLIIGDKNEWRFYTLIYYKNSYIYTVTNMQFVVSIYQNQSQVSRPSSRRTGTQSICLSQLGCRSSRVHCCGLRMCQSLLQFNWCRDWDNVVVFGFSRCSRIGGGQVESPFPEAVDDGCRFNIGPCPCRHVDCIQKC